MCCITCDASGRVNKSNVNANVKGSISAADRKRNHQGFFYSSIINEGWRLIYRLITRLHRERDTMMEGVNKKERVVGLVSYRNLQAFPVHRETRGNEHTSSVKSTAYSSENQYGVRDGFQQTAAICSFSAVFLETVGVSVKTFPNQATNIHDLTN